MPEKKELIGFCLIILLALVLRFSGICFDSLWLDESYQSLTSATGRKLPDFTQTCPDKFVFRFDRPLSPQQMLGNFRSVDRLCPPLYPLLLNQWISVLGQSDFVLRSFSAILSTLALAALLVFARCWLSAPVAFWAGLFMAVSPFDIHYAQEARMYSLVTLNAVLSCGSLLWALKNNLGRLKSLMLLPLYVISTWALINSHYTALFLVAGQVFAAVAWLAARRDWRKLAFVCLAWLLLAAVWIPWLPMFFQAAHLRKESFYVARTPDFIWPLKALFIRIPVNWLVFLSGQRVVAYAAGIYASSLIMLVAGARQAAAARENKFELAALWCWALLPALGLWFIDVLENHRVIEVARYVIFTSPPVYMLAGAGMAALIRARKYFAWILVFHLVFAGLNLFYTHSVKQREPWQDMAATVEALVSPDELLVVSQYYDIACLDRYLRRPRLHLGLSPSMGREVVCRKLSSLQKFSLVTAQEGESIVNMLPAEFVLRKRIDLCHGLHLRLFDRVPDRPS